MIRLAGNSGTAPSYTTTVSHTGKDLGTKYLITHNLNTLNVGVVVRFPDGANDVQMINTMYSPPDHLWGYTVVLITLNSVTVDMRAWYPTAGNALDTRTATVLVTALT